MVISTLIALIKTHNSGSFFMRNMSKNVSAGGAVAALAALVEASALDWIAAAALFAAGLAAGMWLAIRKQR